MPKLNKLLRFLMLAAFPSYVDDPAGGGGATTFSAEYVRELREENKSWRLKADALEKKIKEGEEMLATKIKAAEDAVANSAKEIETKVADAAKAAGDKILRAELKVAATAAGLVDMDGLKLADLSKVSLKEDGTIEGAEALFKGLKEAKPYLFGAATTSTTQTPPANTPPAAKSAMQMTAAEYAAAKAAAIK